MEQQPLKIDEKCFLVAKLGLEPIPRYFKKGIEGLDPDQSGSMRLASGSGR